MKKEIKITTIEELQNLDCVDDVQVVSDGSYGYIVVLVTDCSQEEEKMIEDIPVLNFRRVNEDLYISDAIEGTVTGWV